MKLNRQDSVNKLRSTVLLASSSMETSLRKIFLLGQKMAAASERLWDTKQDSRHVILLLTWVLERLQAVLDDNQSQKPAQNGRRGQRQESRCCGCGEQLETAANQIPAEVQTEELS